MFINRKLIKYYTHHSKLGMPLSVIMQKWSLLNITNGKIAIKQYDEDTGTPYTVFSISLSR